NLNPYALTEVTNDITSPLSGANSLLIAVTSTSPANSFVSSSNPLTIQVTGYTTQNSLTTQSATFSSVGASGNLNYYPINGIELNNVTNIQMYLGNHAAVPYPGFTVTVYDWVAGQPYADAKELASLSPIAYPELMYTQAGYNYQKLYPTTPTSPVNVTYTQPGQPQQTFALASVTPSSTGRSEYFNYTISEFPVPGQQTNTDNVVIGITNSSAGITSTPLYYLNATALSPKSPSSLTNNVTYVPSGFTSTTPFNVGQGFVTERGSEVASIGSTSITLDLAKSVDMLQFAVAPSTTTVSKSYKVYGPFGIGQATNIPNVTVANIAASGVTMSSSAHYTITGISNITATPSVSTADEPVLLSNLPTNPLVVLDSNANSASNLILVGSGYVNTLSAQLQKSYNISMTPTTQIDQAYGTNRILIAGYYANQTTAAANAFIQQLYAAAASS
ncbi:MAG: S-layer protein, partial [Candidatus Micrarchaeaceae archaeon]